MLEGVLSRAELDAIRGQVDDVFTTERKTPFDPDGGQSNSDDESIEAFVAENYTVGEAELARIIRRVGHTRAENLHTPWPVDVAQVNKLFLHLPTLFDDDRSQRIWNLLAKADRSCRSDRTSCRARSGSRHAGGGLRPFRLQRDQRRGAHGWRFLARAAINASVFWASRCWARRRSICSSIEIATHASSTVLSVSAEAIRYPSPSMPRCSVRQRRRWFEVLCW